METKDKIAIDVVDINSPYLDQVKKLGRRYSGTLGMMPDGAFDDYACRNSILGAVSRAGDCIGYVLYRVTKGRATIAHLCVSKDFQGKGVSRALVDRLVTATKERGLCGISLSCRRDYDASKVWPRLGFVPLNDRPGKSVDGKPLTFWWLDHHLPDLFRQSAEMLPHDKRLAVVIDANVFFDLYDEADCQSDESKALTADWLQDSIELCLTDEIYTEINRNADSKERERQRGRARLHRIIESEREAVNAKQKLLRQFFPAVLTASDESDLRQLAKAVAGGAQLFVTRDKDVLDKADDFYDACRISVLRPTALINQLDTLRRESDYQPVRLGGSHLKTRLVGNNDENDVLAVFQASAKGESEGAFLQRFRSLLASPQKFSCKIAEDDQERPLAVYAYARPNSRILEIPFLRVRRDTLAPTMVRHLLARALQTSASEGRSVSTVTEPNLDNTIFDALAEMGFTAHGAAWSKVNLDVAGTADDLAHRLDQLVSEGCHASTLATSLSASVKAWKAQPDEAGAIALERALWPAKIVDADVPCFIVPIQPHWAQGLFDEGLANQELFGERPELVLLREQVYYRANQRCGLRSPGRLLWYVSSDSDRYGTMSIRACSRLDEILVDKPKELFRRFRRLGVYEWRDVFKKSGNDLEKLMMTLRFSDTELFHVYLCLATSSATWVLNPTCNHPYP